MNLDHSAIVIFILLFCFIEKPSKAQWNLRPKHLRIESIKNCTVYENTPIIVDHFDISQPTRQKYALNSTVHVLRDVKQNLFFKMDTIFCSFKQADECRKIDIMPVPNVCKQLTEPISLLKSVVKSVQPPLSCPLKEGRYHVENQVFDLGIMTRVPIEPGKLNVNLTVFDYIKNEKNQTKKQLYVCLNIQVTLTPLRLYHKASNSTPRAIN